MAWTEFFARWYNGRISPVYSETQNAGRVLFVSSVTGTDAAGYGGSPESPYATLAQAYADVVTGEGWKIILMPGHAETVDTAAWLTIAKTNLEILGIGNGALIPTFTAEGADAIPLIDINVDAANVTIKHVKFLNSEDACAGFLDINAAGCTFDDCIFADDGTANSIDFIIADANADDLTIKNCKNWGTDTAGNDSWVSVTGALDHLTITGCHSHGDFAAGNIVFDAAAIDIDIKHNWLENVNAVDVNIEGFAALEGWVAENMCQIPTDGQVTFINTPGNIGCYENFGANQPGETGLLIIAAGVSA